MVLAFGFWQVIGSKLTIAIFFRFDRENLFHVIN